MDGFFFIICLFTWLIISGILKHQRRMAELKIKSGYSPNTGGINSSEIAELTRQIAELRDTTTRYDMSFDSALQRLESRVGHLETRSTHSAAPDPAYARKAE